MATEQEHEGTGALEGEHIEQMIEGVLSLPVESQLGFLLLVTPQILARFPMEARERFLQELSRETRRVAPKSDGTSRAGAFELPVPEME